MTCDMCGKEKKTVTVQPSQSQLIFGGFRGKIMEHRCQACETKVAKSIQQMLDKLTGSQPV